MYMHDFSQGCGGLLLSRLRMNDLSLTSYKYKHSRTVADSHKNKMLMHDLLSGCASVLGWGLLGVHVLIVFPRRRSISVPGRVDGLAVCRVL